MSFFWHCRGGSIFGSGFIFSDNVDYSCFCMVFFCWMLDYLRGLNLHMVIRVWFEHYFF